MYRAKKKCLTESRRNIFPPFLDIVDCTDHRSLAQLFLRRRM